ncbi:efflux transporter periplasmic adaptor subunit [Sulfuriferula sp. AH1]|uniref:efflux RND transporter periplasmic adaptor subunit n=1 Tax=Sulfuriferula sp. AH1 TaxID=1985873 RepID=UPI000B3B2416|nr:efflux RND transporter periplasmic adaptor subunit [Sulfuriferula sp. AH1]ARU30281.1 efflux transporter periplasmic adaptor subunit [Sulfuriferula sp. AH1]
MNTSSSLASICALSLLALSLSGCSDDKKPAASAVPAATAVVTDPTLVTPPPAVVARITVKALASYPIADVLRVAGQVDFDEQRIARIGSTVTGRVVEVRQHLGNTVKAGDVLAVLNSAELGQAQLAYLKARSQAALEQRNVERAKLLLTADVIGTAELQRRENALEMAQAEHRAAADQLKVLGMSEAGLKRIAQTGNIDSLKPLTATTAGIVVERSVTQGQVVTPSDPMFTIADLSHLWVVAEVPEQQAAGARIGQDVAIEIPALNGEQVGGRLVYISDTVNPQTRTVLVRTSVENKQRRLKPAMLATMLIATEAVPRLALPATAVVRENNQDYVFVQTKPGQFKLTEVRLAPEVGGLRPVLSGVRLGDSVVIDGAFHLNNERNRQALEGA